MNNRTLLLPPLLLLLPAAAYAQCNPKEFRRIFAEARLLQDSGHYIEAKNTYEAAKIYVCNKKEALLVDNTVDSLFDRIERSRLETIRERNRADSIAEANRRQVLTGYADNLAYKSAIALENGDPATAFRLAELAQRYVEPENDNVTRALVDNIYYAENTENLRLAWTAFSLDGHTRSVMSVAFSPDGKSLATASEDGTIRLWDLQTGLPADTFRVNGLVRQVAFSPDSRHIAGLSEEFRKTENGPAPCGIVRVWNLASRRIVYTLQDPVNYWLCAAFSPDGAYLATGAHTGQITIWQAKSGDRVRTIAGHTKKVRSLDFSPDSKLLASGSQDNTAKIWTVVDGKEIASLEEHTSFVNAVAFSPDSTTLATGSNDKTIQIWDRAGQKVLKTLTGHRSIVFSLAFSPDGKWLISGSMDNTAKIWSVTTGLEVFAPLRHADQIRSVAFAPNSRYVATAGGRNFGASDKTVRVWDLGAKDFALWVQDTSETTVTSLAFSPDGRKLAAGYVDNKVIVRDVQTGREILPLTGLTREITSLAFSDDGTFLIAGTGNDTLIVWNAETGTVKTTLSGLEGVVHSVAFSAGNRYVAAAAGRGYEPDGLGVKVWDLSAGKAVLSLGGPDRNVNCLAFTPDGRYLAVGTNSDTIRFWNLAIGKPDAMLTGHGGTVECIAFSPDGAWCATGSTDNQIKIWDWRQGKNTRTLKGHSADISLLAFFPDGDRLLSVSKSNQPLGPLTGEKDNSIKVWDLHSGKILLSLSGYDRKANQIAFSPRGKRIAVTANEASIKILELSPESLIDPVPATRIVATLTPDQLDAYDLENLLDLRPENETLLIGTGNFAQIKAFAALAAAQAAGSNILARVEPHYARADRLYAAALALQDEPLIRKDYASMLRQWAEVYAAEGLVSKAGELKSKAAGLWKE